MSIKNRRTELDKYDVAILSALATNTRLTAVEFATVVHLSRTAVSRRIAVLKKMRVLNDSAEVLNYESIGFGVRAIVEVSVSSQSIAAISKKLLVQPEVLTITTMAGDNLLSLDVIAIDLEHLHRFVDSLRDSGNTTTKIIFAAEKSRLTLVDRMRILREQTETKSEHP